jgi:hypothetical protein
MHSNRIESLEQIAYIELIYRSFLKVFKPYKWWEKSDLDRDEEKEGKRDLVNHNLLEGNFLYWGRSSIRVVLVAILQSK